MNYNSNKKGGYDPRISEGELPYFLKSEGGNQAAARLTNEISGLRPEKAKELLNTVWNGRGKYPIK